MLRIKGEQGGIERRTAGAETVWELPSVFLCVMNANPGPLRLQQQYKEASVWLSQLQP